MIMKRFSLLLVACLALLSAACKPAVPGQVKVTGGIIQGEVTEDMCIYKGPADQVGAYNEIDCPKGALGHLAGGDLMDLLLG